MKEAHVMYKLIMKCAHILAMSDPAYVECERRNG